MRLTALPWLLYIFMCVCVCVRAPRAVCVGSCEGGRARQLGSAARSFTIVYGAGARASDRQLKKKLFISGRTKEMWWSRVSD